MQMHRYRLLPEKYNRTSLDVSCKELRYNSLFDSLRNDELIKMNVLRQLMKVIYIHNLSPEFGTVSTQNVPFSFRTLTERILIDKVHVSCDV